MSYILSVYSTKAFKEYLLPAIDNADYILSLPKNLFDLTENVDIPMEIINGQWKITKEADFAGYYTISKESCIGHVLKNEDIISIVSKRGEQISLIVKETDQSFMVYEKYSLINVNEITIGKSEDNVISYSSLNLVSREHARILRNGGQYIVEDTSNNGIFVNSKRVVGAWQLTYGDCIDIFGLRLVFLGTFMAINTLLDGVKIKEGVLTPFNPVYSLEEPSRFNRQPVKLFHRSPRILPKIEKERIEIEAPPNPKELNVQPAFMAIGPSLTMALPMLLGCALSIYSTRVSGGASSAFMYTGLVTAVSSALVGTVWSIVNMRQAKKKNREDELKRFEAYSEYLIKCSNDVKAKYENNSRALYELYRDSETCCRYDEKSLELWNRNSRHEDFLAQRLGIGDMPFQVEIEVPKERFNLINDSLAGKPKMIKESYKMLHSVPICVDLNEHKLIGVIGGAERRGCYPVLHNLVSQIAANNCYTDVKMAFIYDDSEGEKDQNWKFAKWLPHVWSEDKKVRYVAGNDSEASDVFYEITKVLRMRSEEKQNFATRQQIEKPYYVLFLENPDVLEGELIAKYIFDRGNNCGITTVMMVNDYEELPNACEYIIENTPEYQGSYHVADGEDDKTRIQFDLISGMQLEQFSRRLSSIEVNEMETGGDIPNVLTFFDMYGIHRPEELDVMERWRKNRTYDSIKALVGQKAGGVECYLDVHEKYHGPHGLVAGTTGSGKSETLQTYMLSLALNYSPDDVGFFVIDYKGGGMANLFEGLPHMIGQISNLSGNQVHRAMVSIKSENLRRQRIFNEHGVNNINLYTRLYKNNEATIPVPHMFIIIDEFAELKREEPDFMRELISVAQVGRSLGVHLILATQKPSGTVDDNIWSNSKFRLCLRVQDRQDSTDMLHRPDAAYITQAGRCYLQVGNDELFELFQSAWSGAVYDEEAGAQQLNIARMLSDSGKAALVGSHAKIKQKEKVKKQWIDLLLRIVDESASRLRCRVQDCVHDSSLGNTMALEFYRIVEEQGVEYAESDYNYHRVQDLIAVYGEVLDRQENGTELSGDVVSAVISTAMEKGKKLPEMKEKTQLDAVVEYLARVAQQNGYVRNLQLWLPVLPTELYLDELVGYKRHSFDGRNWPERNKRFSLETIIGLYDDPVNQAQQPITLDLARDGNHAIIGTVVSGKSTFLMTYLYSLVNRYTPETVNIYILDYSSKMLGALDGLAHVGGVMYENDDEKVAKFFTMIESILEERKQLFKGGSYSQYIQANGLVVPAIVIAIDNMASFKSKTSNMYEDLLMTLVKEGVGYGIYMIVTAGGFSLSEIPSRMGENFRTVICLEMNDKFAYSDALRTMHLDVLPEENVKGRGLAKVGDSILEFQTALCVKAEDDYKRGEMVKEHCGRINAAWNGKCARLIPEIPENPVWNEYSQLADVQQMHTEGVRLPVGYDKRTAAVYGIDLRSNYCYMISGKSRSGKTNALRLIAASARMIGGQVTIIDFAGDLKSVADSTAAEYVSSASALYDFFMDISPDFRQRNQYKKACMNEGISDETLFDGMQQFSKRFILISDLAEFVQKVHNPDGGVGDMVPFLSTLLEKGAMHNVFWFAAFNQDDAAKVAGLTIYNTFVKYKTGMHLGGNVMAQRILPFDHVPYTEQSKTYKPGTAMLPTHEEDDTTMVVLPLY